MNTPNNNQHSGFTTVELIVVLALVGIVSAVVLPRFNTPQNFQNLVLKDVLISQARLAQQTALSRFGQNVALTLSANANDWVFTLTVNGVAIDTKRVDGGNNGTLTHTNTTSLATTDIAVTPVALNYDNLGNATNGLVANHSFNINNRFVCISAAGHSYETPDQATCVNN